MQTALVEAYAAWGRVRGADDPVAYVDGILVKAFLSERRRRSSGELPTDTHVLRDRAVAQPGAESTERVDRLVLVAALSRLSPLDRAVVLLRHWEDRSVAETAAELRLSPAAEPARPARAAGRAGRAARRARPPGAPRDRPDPHPDPHDDEPDDREHPMSLRDDTLHDHLHDALDDLRAPVGLAPAVIGRGRRVRARHRLVGGLAATAAAVVVGGLVLTGLGGATGTPGRDDSGTDRLATAPPSSEPVPVGWWSAPSRQLAATLERLLPAGVEVVSAVTTTETEEGEEPGIGHVSGVLRGPVGEGAFQLLLRPMPSGPERAGVLADLRCRPRALSCAQVTSADGVLHGRLSTDRERGTTFHSLSMVDDEGGSLYLYVADSVGEKPGYTDPTSPRPPMTPEQLLELGGSPQWRAFRP